MIENILEESFRLELWFLFYLTAILVVTALMMTVLTASYFSRLTGRSFRSTLSTHVLVGLIGCVCSISLLFGQSLSHHEENAQRVSTAIERDDYAVRQIWGIDALVIIYPSRNPLLFNDGIFLTRTSGEEMVASIRKRQSKELSRGF